VILASNILVGGILALFIFVRGAIMSKYSDTTYAEIPFEKVAQYEISPDDKNINNLYWFSLRDDSFNGWFTTHKLTDMGIDFNEIEFNYKEHTYVATIGYELHSISYSYSDMKNWRFSLAGFVPKQFVGKVELRNELKNIVCIYSIERMDIDCDYHERDRNVFFVD
jgi:hypothetical protein